MLVSRIPTLAPLLALLLLPGCDSASVSDGDHRGVTVDTLPSGVVRVVNRPTQAPLRMVERLRLGTLDGEGPELFGQIKGLAVTPEGLVAVLESQAQEVRVFDRDGRHLAAHGGQGEGPGEFTDAFGMALSPDGRLTVPDHGNDRITFLDARDGYLDSEPLTFLRFGFTWDGEQLDDGRIVQPSVTLEAPRRDLLLLLDARAQPLDTVVLPERPETDPEDPPTSFFFQVRGSTGRGYMGVPFAERGAFGIHPAGVIWTAPSLAESYRLARLSLELDTTLVVEVVRAPVAIPGDVRDGAVNRLQELMRERNADIGDQSWDKIPTRYPFVERVFPGESGEVWVETGSVEGARFDVFGPDGVLRRTIDTDLEFASFVSPVARGDEVWGVVLGEFEVPYVVRAAIEDGAR